jgi:hypothetical protein
VIVGVLVYSIMKALLMSPREQGSSNSFYREQAFEANGPLSGPRGPGGVAIAFIASRRLKLPHASGLYSWLL